MKKLLPFILAVIVLIYAPIPSFAYEYVFSSYNDNSLSFDGELPEDMKGLLNGGEIGGGIDEESFFASALSKLRDAVAAPYEYFLSLISLCVLLAVLSLISESFGGQVPTLLSSVITSLTVFSHTYKVFAACASAIGSITRYVHTMLPIMSSIYIAGGNTGASIAQSSVMLIFTSFLSYIASELLLPLLSVIFAFSLLSSLGGGLDTSGIAKQVKGAFSFVLGATVFALSLFLTYKSDLAMAADSVSMKTVKFAMGSFVPVIGSASGEALRTVGGSLMLIKSTVGTLALCGLLLIVLPPIAELLLYRFFTSLASALSKTVGAKREGDILSDAADIYGLMLSLLYCASILFLIAITVFIKSNLAVAA